jgi:hypothetical protein
VQERSADSIDFENMAKYGDKWFLLREHIAQGLARPVPEEELLRVEADFRLFTELCYEENRSSRSV